MKKIEILGACCSNCQKLYVNAKAAVNEKGIEAEVLKVEDMGKIVEYGVMSIPALVVDGEVKSAGRALSIEEIKKII